MSRSQPSKPDPQMPRLYCGSGQVDPVDFAVPLPPVGFLYRLAASKKPESSRVGSWDSKAEV